MDVQSNEEHLPHLLLVVHEDDKRIYGMKGLGKYDEFETAKVIPENMTDFKEFKRNDTLLFDFVLHFFQEMETPAAFKLFLVPKQEAISLTKLLQQSIDNPSKEGTLVLKKYELTMDKVEKKANEILDNQKKIYEKNEMKIAPAPKRKGRKM